MLDWMLVGLLAAVLMAEVMDALALRQLVRYCLYAQPQSPEEKRLVRWYAEGFDHARAISSWLTGASLVLAAGAFALGANPALVIAAVLLAAIAHCERRISMRLRRRFLCVNPR